MAFWGEALKAGQKKKVQAPEGEVLHLSQGCLHEPKDGKNYVQAEVKGQTYSIACLEKGKQEHISFDLFFSAGETTFVNKGSSEVHLTGYFEPDQMDGEGSESEDAAPAAPAKRASPLLAKAASPKVVAASSPKQSPKLAAAAAAAKAAEEDDDDEDEEEEESMGDESGEEEDEEEDEEDEPAPPPAKKQKGEPAKSSPKAAPMADGEAGYVKQLFDFLKKNGKTPISKLGSSVQRPKDCPKMKQVLTKYADKFTIKGEDVSAK